MASAEALPRGALLRVEVGGVPVCLARTADGAFYAIGDRCTHEEASLSEGELVGLDVECPLHGSLFDVHTGAVRGAPATAPATTYPVTVLDGEVHVDI